MKTKTSMLALMLVAILLVGIIPAVAAEDEPDLVRLTVMNQTGGTIYLQLNGTNLYYLTIPAGATSLFTVEKGEYIRQTWACSLHAQGTLDLSSQVKLNFTPCDQEAVNAGEPTQEKVSLYDSPTSTLWRYQD